LESKLKTYSAIAAGVVAATSVSNAQIVYTDVNPDVMLSDSSYMIDLNQDAVGDFNVIHIAYSYGSTSFLNLIGLQALNNNEVLGDTIVSSTYSDISFYPAMLDANDDIEENGQIWFNSSYGMMYYNGVYGSYNFKGGDWQNATDKYLGLRISINGKWHYGWARLDITSNGTAFIIKDYAYESSPETQIWAGVKSSSVLDDPTKAIQVFSGPNNLIIKTNGVHVDGNQVNIFNSVGQKMQTVDINSRKNIISLGDFTPGVYIVNMTVAGQPLSKKFIVR